MDDGQRQDVRDPYLDRQLSGAFRITPSPEFVARVRLRVATEAMAGNKPNRLAFVGAAGALAAIALALTVVAWRVETEAPDIVARPLAFLAIDAPVVLPDVPVTRTPDARRESGSDVSRLQRPIAGAVVTDADARALIEFVSQLREGRVTATQLGPPELSSGELEPLMEIEIQPLAIERLPPMALLEGDRP